MHGDHLFVFAAAAGSLYSLFITTTAGSVPYWVVGAGMQPFLQLQLPAALCGDGTPIPHGDGTDNAVEPATG
jgi:hypothetical protein